MRNIYQEDFSSEDLQELQGEKSAPSASRPVRPAKQAPPPIKKSVIAPKQPTAPAESTQPLPYGQPGFYPQPVFYQPDANGQPVPVFYAPQPYMTAPYQQPQAPAESAAAEAVIAELAPVQAEYKRIIADNAYINECMAKGAERAGRLAQRTLDKCMKKIGFKQI